MATADLVKGLLLFACISAMILISQYAIQDINPNSNFMDGYDSSTSSLSVAGNLSSGTMSGVNGSLPSASQSISPTTEVQYTDIVQTSLNWINDNPFFKAIFDIVTAPNTIARYVFPGNSYIPAIIGGLFYAIIIFLLVSWILSKV
jgi:hypothetical protein